MVVVVVVVSSKSQLRRCSGSSAESSVGDLTDAVDDAGLDKNRRRRDPRFFWERPSLPAVCPGRVLVS